MEHQTLYEALLYMSHSTLKDEAFYTMNLPCSLTATVTLKLFLIFYPNTIEGRIL